MVGFIFYPKSPRYVYQGGVDQVLASADGVMRVGVFVNEDLSDVEREVKYWKLDVAQLHGDEDVEYCEALTSRCPALSLVKAFQMKEEFDFEVTKPYEAMCDHFLFDTATAGYGGSGRTFSWELLKEYGGDVSCIVSGGLSAETVPALLTFFKNNPELDRRVVALDFNSGVETAPGEKSIEKIQEIIEIVRQG
jgi:phosphoribosylanthranilate isomerase